MPLDINISLHSYRPHTEIKRGLLEIVCQGKDCNDQFLNSLGRIATERLAMYAFHIDLIDIPRINPETGYTGSVPFNNDYMRLRLKNTPLMNIDPGFAVLHEQYWKDVDYRLSDRPIHENEKKIEAYIDIKNEANISDIDENILHVTTNDMKIYIDGVLSKPYSEKYPLLIISLKPKEAFKCNMRAVLGVGLMDPSWFACSNFCYDQETIPDATILKMQSASQFDEFVLINRALEYFETRTKSLKDEIKRLYSSNPSNTDRFQIEIIDETHTMGEPINYELQSHPNILKSSIIRPDLLIRRIIIDIIAINKDVLLISIMESMDNLIVKINTFKKEFNKLQPEKEKENKKENKKEKEKETKKENKKEKKTKSKRN